AFEYGKDLFEKGSLGPLWPYVNEFMKQAENDGFDFGSVDKQVMRCILAAVILAGYAEGFARRCVMKNPFIRQDIDDESTTQAVLKGSLLIVREYIFNGEINLGILAKAERELSRELLFEFRRGSSSPLTDEVANTANIFENGLERQRKKTLIVDDDRLLINDLVLMVECWEKHVHAKYVINAFQNKETLLRWLIKTLSVKKDFFVVETAFSAEEAWRIYDEAKKQGDPFEIVCSDYYMLGETGVWLAERIRNEVPVILITAEADNDKVQEALSNNLVLAVIDKRNNLIMDLYTALDEASILLNKKHAFDNLQGSGKGSSPLAVLNDDRLLGALVFFKGSIASSSIAQNLPAHWDAAWKIPSEYAFEEAGKFLSGIRSRMTTGSGTEKSKFIDINQLFVNFSEKRIKEGFDFIFLSYARKVEALAGVIDIFRALYFIHPDAAANTLTQMKLANHVKWHIILMSLEASFFGKLVNAAIRKEILNEQLSIKGHTYQPVYQLEELIHTMLNMSLENLTERFPSLEDVSLLRFVGKVVTLQAKRKDNALYGGLYKRERLFGIFSAILKQRPQLRAFLGESAQEWLEPAVEIPQEIQIQPVKDTDVQNNSYLLKVKKLFPLRFDYLRKYLKLLGLLVRELTIELLLTANDARVITQSISDLEFSISRGSYSEAIRLWTQFLVELAALRNEDNPLKNKAFLESKLMFVSGIFIRELNKLWAECLFRYGLDTGIPQALGKAVGQLKVIKDFRALDEQELSQGDYIVAASDYPAEAAFYPGITGIISIEARGITSHASVRVGARGIPCVNLELDLGVLEYLEGEWMFLEAQPHQVSFRRATEEEIAQRKTFRSEIARPQILEIDTSLQSPNIVLGYAPGIERLIGHKAAFQLYLKSLNICQVPDSIALTFPAFLKIMNAESNKYDAEEIEKLLASINLTDNEQMKEALENVIWKIMGLNIPQEMENEIIASVNANFKEAVILIIRASTNAEDLPLYPGVGVGIYGSFYCSKNNYYILQAINLAYASLSRLSAFRERELYGIKHVDVLPAVLIQELMIGDYSFGMHTAHPLTKDRRHLFLEVVQGLGAGLRDEKCPGLPHQFIYDKQTQDIARLNFADKPKKLTVVLEGYGSCQECLLATDYSADIFTQEPGLKLAGEIFRLGVKIEEIFGRPQDIEGVIKINGSAYPQIYIVQSRSQKLSSSSLAIMLEKVDFANCASPLASVLEFNVFPVIKFALLYVVLVIVPLSLLAAHIAYRVYRSLNGLPLDISRVKSIISRCIFLAELLNFGFICGILFAEYPKTMLKIINFDSMFDTIPFMYFATAMLNYYMASVVISANNKELNKHIQQMKVDALTGAGRFCRSLQTADDKKDITPTSSPVRQRETLFDIGKWLNDEFNGVDEENKDGLCENMINRLNSLGLVIMRNKLEFRTNELLGMTIGGLFECSWSMDGMPNRALVKIIADPDKNRLISQCLDIEHKNLLKVHVSNILYNDGVIPVFFEVFEYFEGALMSHLIGQGRKFSVQEMQIILRSLQNALSYLHTEIRICHGALSSRAVIIGKGKVKLGYFDYARPVRKLGAELFGPEKDWKQLDALMDQLKGSSASPLAQGLKNSHTVIEIDARALVKTYGGTIKDVPQEFWDWIISLRPAAVWIKAVWERSPLSERLMQYWSREAGEENIMRLASGYDVYRYRLDPNIAKNKEEFKKVSQYLAQHNIKIILDYVTNHIAVDSPEILRVPGLVYSWAELKHYSDYTRRIIPDRTAGFSDENLRSWLDDESRYKAFFRLNSGVNSRIIAHARQGPFDDFMINLAQINYMSKSGRRFMLDTALREIADLTLCGGARLDLAFTALRKHIFDCWAWLKGISAERFYKKIMPQEFLKEFMEYGKANFPGMINIAEVYEWPGKENTPWLGRSGNLQEFGFITYNKLFYDLIHAGNIVLLRDYLFMKPEVPAFLRKSIHFVEDHDEPSAHEAFGSAQRALAAAVILYCLPGYALVPLRQIFGMGTPAGVKMSMKSSDAAIYKFQYPDVLTGNAQVDTQLLEVLRFIAHPVFTEGQFYSAKLETPSDKNLGGIVPFIRHLEGESDALVVVNYSNEKRRFRFNLDTVFDYAPSESRLKMASVSARNSLFSPNAATYFRDGYIGGDLPAWGWQIVRLTHESLNSDTASSALLLKKSEKLLEFKAITPKTLVKKGETFTILSMERKELGDAVDAHNAIWGSRYRLTLAKAERIFNNNPGAHLVIRNAEGQIILVLWVNSLFAKNRKDILNSLSLIENTPKNSSEEQDNYLYCFAVGVTKEYQDKGLGPYLATEAIYATRELLGDKGQYTFTPLGGYQEYEDEMSPMTYLLMLKNRKSFINSETKKNFTFGEYCRQIEPKRISPAAYREMLREDREAYFDYRREGRISLRQYLSWGRIAIEDMIWDDYISFITHWGGIPIENYMKLTGRSIACPAENVHLKNHAIPVELVEGGRPDDYYAAGVGIKNEYRKLPGLLSRLGDYSRIDIPDGEGIISLEREYNSMNYTIYKNDQVAGEMELSIKPEGIYIRNIRIYTYPYNWQHQGITSKMVFHLFDEICKKDNIPLVRYGLLTKGFYSIIRRCFEGYRKETEVQEKEGAEFKSIPFEEIEGLFGKVHQINVTIFPEKEASSPLGKSVDIINDRFEDIIKESVRQNRPVMRAVGKERCAQDLPDAVLLSGLCCLSSFDLARRIHILSAGKPKIIAHNALVLFGDIGQGFLIVISPDGKKYLVDTTFIQMFNEIEQEDFKERKAILESVQKKYPDWGWQEKTEQLLENGFIELDDNVVNMYGCLLGNIDPSRKSFSMNDLLIEPTLRDAHNYVHLFPEYARISGLKQLPDRFGTDYLRENYSGDLTDIIIRTPKTLLDILSKGMGRIEKTFTVKNSYRKGIVDTFEADAREFWQQASAFLESLTNINYSHLPQDKIMNFKRLYSIVDAVVRAMLEINYTVLYNLSNEGRINILFKITSGAENSLVITVYNNALENLLMDNKRNESEALLLYSQAREAAIDSVWYIVRPLFGKVCLHETLVKRDGGYGDRINIPLGIFGFDSSIRSASPLGQRREGVLEIVLDAGSEMHNAYAGFIAELARRFTSEITLEFGGKQVNAKDMLELTEAGYLLYNARKVKFIAEGQDSKLALYAFRLFFKEYLNGAKERLNVDELLKRVRDGECCASPLASGGDTSRLASETSLSDYGYSSSSIRSKLFSFLGRHIIPKPQILEKEESTLDGLQQRSNYRPFIPVEYRNMNAQKFNLLANGLPQKRIEEFLAFLEVVEILVVRKYSNNMEDQHIRNNRGYPYCCNRFAPQIKRILQSYNLEGTMKIVDFDITVKAILKAHFHYYWIISLGRRKDEAGEFILDVAADQFARGENGFMKISPVVIPWIVVKHNPGEFPMYTGNNPLIFSFPEGSNISRYFRTSSPVKNNDFETVYPYIRDRVAVGVRRIGHNPVWANLHNIMEYFGISQGGEVEEIARAFITLKKNIIKNKGKTKEWLVQFEYIYKAWMKFLGENDSVKDNIGERLIPRTSSELQAVYNLIFMKPEMETQEICQLLQHAMVYSYSSKNLRCEAKGNITASRIDLISAISNIRNNSVGILYDMERKHILTKKERGTKIEQLYIHAYKQGDLLTIEIADTAGGIPEEFLQPGKYEYKGVKYPKIFDYGFTAGKKGTGVG
ncbi:MAG: HPr family phosphocarrier protein, partial [Candidatus Omnitrophica bacterium]|nr:HPr family phosphocarrier protein [Candidatus Omnitrophota bacterium]